MRSSADVVVLMCRTEWSADVVYQRLVLMCRTEWNADVVYQTLVLMWRTDVQRQRVVLSCTAEGQRSAPSCIVRKIGTNE